MLGSFYKVTSTANGRSVVVQCFDTGGFGRYGRVLDLGKRAFAELDDPAKGVIEVTMEEVTHG